MGRASRKMRNEAAAAPQPVVNSANRRAKKRKMLASRVSPTQWTFGLREADWIVRTEPVRTRTARTRAVCSP